ncbi:hypothetical protein K435DRAFT_862428 [Dendrothele bispora CBS 962.96]|uniref:Uncharacterized protein n=1 Tax=Dendrothele bispora (strain CBS 962.96) TaxID=1314807 RepID=A0A4S8LSM6_DENBC|nr:hypothetical protein K435DRAFT_862428 [Dendrothele bispora CBS 962.96]
MRLLRVSEPCRTGLFFRPICVFIRRARSRPQVYFNNSTFTVIHRVSFRQVYQDSWLILLISKRVKEGEEEEEFEAESESNKQLSSLYSSPVAYPGDISYSHRTSQQQAPSRFPFFLFSISITDSKSSTIPPLSVRRLQDVALLTRVLLGIMVKGNENERKDEGRSKGRESEHARDDGEEYGRHDGYGLLEFGRVRDGRVWSG